MARADRQARARRRLLAALAAAVSLLLVATGASGAAVNRQRAASAAGRQARRIGWARWRWSRPTSTGALLLAVQAVRTHDDWETRGDLLAVLGRSPQALRQVRGQRPAGTIEHVALTRDGSTLVAPRPRRRPRVHLERGDARAAGRADPVRTPPEAITPGPDPSGVYISVAIDYAPGYQAVIHWDARSGRVMATYPLPRGIAGSTRRTALSRDGGCLAVPTAGPVAAL